MKKSDVHIIIKYAFHRRATAANMARNINNVFATQIVNKRTLRDPFSSNIKLTNLPYDRHGGILIILV